MVLEGVPPPGIRAKASDSWPYCATVRFSGAVASKLVNKVALKCGATDVTTVFDPETEPAI